MSTCFFIGHRETSDSIFPALLQAVKRHITEYGVTEFVVGHYGNFDRLAARAVLHAERAPPAGDALSASPLSSRRPATPVPEGFDGTFYPPGMERVPKRAAIVRANRYMADHCDFLIAYAWHPASNARELVDYAQARGTVQVDNLWDHSS